MALKNTLQNMIEHVTRQRGGEPVRVHLSKGLTISLRVGEREGLYDLQLTRADVYPSTREWKAVIDAWPGQAVEVCPPRGLLGGHQYHLRGQVRVYPRLME
jgi:hypothetical protein